VQLNALDADKFVSAGLRASIYNAITEDEVERLVVFIKEFIQMEKEARA
jgi:phosphoserine aminotransferase